MIYITYMYLYNKYMYHKRRLSSTSDSLFVWVD